MESCRFFLRAGDIPPRLTALTGPESWTAPGAGIRLCHPGRAEGLRWQQLGEKEAPDSGTGPIHQEHMMCSRFSGPCGSAVKAAPHPESGASFSPSCCSAALCSSRVTQTAPQCLWQPRIRAGQRRLRQKAYPNQRKNRSWPVPSLLKAKKKTSASAEVLTLLIQITNSLNR